MALGELSFNRRDFLDLTPRELTNAYNGYRKRMGEQWEMVRHLKHAAMWGHSKHPYTLDMVEVPTDFLKKDVEPVKKMIVKKVSDG